MSTCMERDFVRETAQMPRDPIGQRRSETVAHLSAVAINGNLAVGPDLDGCQASVTAGAVVLGGDRDASTDENSRLLSTRFLFGALRPDRMLLQLIQDFGRADRHDVGVPPHRLPAASGIAAAEFDRVERQGRADLVDLHFKRGHGLYGPVTTHRAGRHAARVERICRQINLRGIVNAERGESADGRHLARKIGQASTVQHMVRGKSDDLAGRPIDPDLRPHFKGVSFDPQLKLLEAVVGEPDGTIREEHPRQRDVERERRVVASAESAAARRAIGADMRGLEGRLGIAEQIRDRCRYLGGRLHADNQIKVLASGVIPGKPAFRLKSHRVDRLRLEFAVQHQKCRIFRIELGANLFAVACRHGIGRPARHREARPYRGPGVLEESRPNPAVFGWRVDIGRVWGRASHPRESKLAVVRHFDRAGFRPEFQNSLVAQREPRLIERVEVLEDQHRHRLPQVERRFAHRAQEVAGIIFGNARADSREVVGGHDHGWLQSAGQRRKVDSGQNVGRIRGADHHRVRSVLRPAREIGSAKIGRVELGSRNLGHGVDAAAAVRGRVPAVPSRQYLALCEAGLLGDCQARHGKRNAARRDRLDEFASRNPHRAAPFIA